MTIEEMTRTVSIYMYYMWNTWCKKEAITIYDEVMGNHFWHKWMTYYDQCEGPTGCAEKLWANMSDQYREKLMQRAFEIYNGSQNKK